MPSLRRLWHRALELGRWVWPQVSRRDDGSSHRIVSPAAVDYVREHGRSVDNSDDEPRRDDG